MPLTTITLYSCVCASHNDVLIELLSHCLFAFLHYACISCRMSYGYPGNPGGAPMHYGGRPPPPTTAGHPPPGHVTNSAPPPTGPGAGGFYGGRMPYGSQYPLPPTTQVRDVLQPVAVLAASVWESLFCWPIKCIFDKKAHTFDLLWCTLAHEHNT